MNLTLKISSHRKTAKLIVPRLGALTVCITSEPCDRVAGAEDDLSEGLYRLEEILTPAPKSFPEYGTQALWFVPVANAAAVQQSLGKRNFLLVHGGDLGVDLRLRKTTGGARLSNQDLANLVEVVRGESDVILTVKTVLFLMSAAGVSRVNPDTTLPLPTPARNGTTARGRRISGNGREDSAEADTLSNHHYSSSRDSDPLDSAFSVNFPECDPFYRPNAMLSWYLWSRQNEYLSSPHHTVIQIPNNTIPGFQGVAAMKVIQQPNGQRHYALLDENNAVVDTIRETVDSTGQSQWFVGSEGGPMTTLTFKDEGRFDANFSAPAGSLSMTGSLSDDGFSGDWRALPESGNAAEGFHQSLFDHSDGTISASLNAEPMAEAPIDFKVSDTFETPPANEGRQNESADPSASNAETREPSSSQSDSSESATDPYSR